MLLIIGVVIIIAIVLLGNRNEKGYQKISVEEANEIMDNHDNIVIIDVRTIEEYQSGHIKNAVCIPNESINNDSISKLPDQEQKILVYCQSGRRSKQASNKLIKLGYCNVFDIGGINAYSDRIVR